MLKRFFLAFLIVIVTAVIVQAFKVVQLRNSVNPYAEYWKGQVDKPGELVYVALGDSAAQGIGASSPEKGYVGLLATRIEQATGKTVKVINLSVSGANVEDVINGQLPQLKNYRPDIVTVEIGSNNIGVFNPATFKLELITLTQALPAGTYVADIPYFGGIIRKNEVALTASSIIADNVKKQNLQLVALQKETHDRQSLFNYSADLFHPSDEGYRIWADAFWKAIKPSLKP